jgi:hypothetical protein
MLRGNGGRSEFFNKISKLYIQRTVPSLDEEASATEPTGKKTNVLPDDLSNYRRNKGPAKTPRPKQ